MGGGGGRPGVKAVSTVPAPGWGGKALVSFPLDYIGAEALRGRTVPFGVVPEHSGHAVNHLTQ